MKVFIESGGLVSAAAIGVDSLWSALVNAALPTAPLPCPAYDSWPWAEVYLAPELGAAELGIDRKILRTMEKQAKLVLHAACQTVAASSVLQDKQVNLAKSGLYLALPTVDEAVPPWSLLETLQQESISPAQPDELASAAFLLREIPVFFGLSTLNSNACAHISARFGYTGAMAAYSPFADAAFQALIDAAESIRNGENQQALVGAVSPKINPQLLLQYSYWGWDTLSARIPSEAAAFALVSAQPCSAYLSGYARGFVLDAADVVEQRAELLQQALSHAGIGINELDWFIAGEDDCYERQALQLVGAPSSLPFLFSEAFIGYAGTAAPLVNINLALSGLCQESRLTGDSQRALQLVDGAARHVALSAAGPEGQYVVVIISREVAQ